MARSAYHAADQKPARPRARENKVLRERIGQVFEASGRTYGPPAWWHAPSSGRRTRSGPRLGCSTTPTTAARIASAAYRELLRCHGVIPGMSRAGNCYDNAKMESFWATLKTELIDRRVFAFHTGAKSDIFWYIKVFYNRARLHGTLDYNSPVDFENSLS